MPQAAERAAAQVASAVEAALGAGRANFVLADGPVRLGTPRDASVVSAREVGQGVTARDASGGV